MDKRIYLLTTIAFVVGMVELIVGGILDVIAADLGITVGRAGLLITVFAFVFGLSAPILLFICRQMERKRLTIIALLVFLIGNIIAIVSPTFGVLIIARVISAIGGSLAVVLCINLASNIVEPAYRGRAIGLVVMGISGSLVLGLPIGVMLGNIFHWRAPFILVSALTACLIVAVFYFMEGMEPKGTISLKQQVITLKNHRLLFAHLTTFFFLAGHMVLYGYLTPYVKAVVGFDGMIISVLYLIFGIAAVTGGGLGGIAADRFGTKRTTLTIIALLAICLLLIPMTTEILVFFWFIIVIWGVMSWAITPPIQTHLMRLSPETSDIQQSLNNAALHFGIAFGTFIGSLVITYQTIQWNAWVGVLFIVLSFITASITLRGNVNLLYQDSPQM